MKQQGLSNNQIIEALQRQGFNTNQILDAMNQADISMQTRRPFDVAGNAGLNASSLVSGQGQFEELDSGRVEEIAEAIIEEKWNDLMENINRIIEWKEKTETRITQMESAVKSMKDDFDKMHVAVLERVGEYDKHIGDVGTEVKALEKVFQKVLPGFIENVSELSRITEELKQSRE
jgi:enamine deaminase RidA (YjgF/YER057c/UK114 family)